jgi:ribosomal protein S18 acetylase RimI-like enzyme
MAQRRGHLAASTDGVIVRAATAGDMPAVGRLGALLIRTHHAFDARRFIADRDDSADGYAWFLGTQLKKRDAVVLVAEVRGQILGYTYATVDEEDWMSLRGRAGVLHDIVVDPDHRGRGIGQRLLDAALDFVKSRGSPQVVLFSAFGNEAAHRMFERAGFRRTMVEMTKEL